jgi:uncharacterized membrane protein
MPARRPPASAGRSQGNGVLEATTAPAAARAAAAPLWLQVSTLILSAGGLGVSLYLAVAHYATSVTLACPDTGVVNCERVTASPESVLFGTFPVATLGLVFFVVMVALTTPWAWRVTWPALRWARLGALAAGIAFVLYLVCTELSRWMPSACGAPACT